VTHLMVSYMPLEKRGLSLTWCISGDVLESSLTACEWLEWPAWDWQHLNVVNVRNYIRDSGDRHDGRMRRRIYPKKRRGMVGASCFAILAPMVSIVMTPLKSVKWVVHRFCEQVNASNYAGGANLESGVVYGGRPPGCRRKRFPLNNSPLFAGITSTWSLHGILPRALGNFTWFMSFAYV